MTTTAFGRFFEFSVPTPDIQASLHFYGELGFAELPVGDIRDYHYGVVTDGRIAIGLHAGGIDEPALSFVHADVQSYLQHVAPRREALVFSRLGSETFHEIGVRTPDGQLLVMMEARTFSHAQLSALPAPITGYACEISLGCRDLDDAENYWTDAGFVSTGDPLDDASAATSRTFVELLAPGLRLGLRTDLAAGQMALRFVLNDLQPTLAALDRCNRPAQRSGNFHRVQAPEGTLLHLIVNDA